MRLFLSLALLLSSPALAQTEPAPAPAPAPAAEKLSIDLPIETLMADPVGKAVMDKEVPSLMAHPAYEQFKSMSLRQLQPYSGGAITDEKIAAVEAALEAASKAKP